MQGAQRVLRLGQTGQLLTELAKAHLGDGQQLAEAVVQLVGQASALARLGHGDVVGQRAQMDEPVLRQAVAGGTFAADGRRGNVGVRGHGVLDGWRSPPGPRGVG